MLDSAFGRSVVRLAATAVTATALALPAMAQEKELKVIGGLSNLNNWKMVEDSFWSETLPEMTGGAVTAAATPIDQMGLQGAEVLRLMRLGVADVAATSPGYISNEVPALEGLDLLGLFPDLPTLEKAVAAYEPVMDEVLAREFNSKLLATWPTPPTAFYCTEPVGSFADLDGRKIRSWTAATKAVIEGMGGTPVQLAFTEVIPALERGVLDCGITGILSGNNARWWEVSDYLYPLAMVRGTWIYVMNLDTWNAFDPETQGKIEAAMDEYQKRAFEIARGEEAEGISCNTGEGDCTLGIPATMTLNPVSDADQEAFMSLVTSSVLPDWQSRCGAECVETWNATVGKAIGYEMVTN